MRILADQCIDRMTEPEALASFLEVIVRFPSQTCENQLLIWKQRPDATNVAGVRSWKKMGRTIRDGEKPIWILLPYVRYISGTGKPCRRDDGLLLLDENAEVFYEAEPAYASGYQAVAVFDIAQTEGGKELGGREYRPEDIEDRLRALSITISEERTDDLPRDLPDGYAADTIFHVAKNLREYGSRYYTVFLRLFTNWVVESMREPGNSEKAPGHGDIITAVCAYCIQDFYLGEGTEIRPALIAMKLKGYSHRERREVIRHISRFFSEIVQYLTITELSFVDTAIVNGLLDTGNVADITAMFTRLQEEPELEEEILYSITGLKDKLICSYEGFPGELYRKKLMDKVILSSPPLATPPKPQKREITNSKESREDMDDERGDGDHQGSLRAG